MREPRDQKASGSRVRVQGGENWLRPFIFICMDIRELQGLEKEKVEVMRRIVGAKWEQCQEFREVVRGIGNKVIVEDTANFFWGRGSLRRVRILWGGF